MANIKKQQTPHSLGYAAGVAGKDPRTCPYAEGTKEAKDWLNGHTRGQTMMWFLHDKQERKQ
jgi:ribosome modulation factor